MDQVSQRSVATADATRSLGGRIAPLGLSLFLVALPLAATTETHRAVDAVFADHDSTATPGCSLGVYRDGRIDYARGYGMANLEHAIANGPRTVFRIASTSKQFTAMAIALLAEEGALSLDDDIRTFFPEMPAYQAPVTVRHLVHHTSGVRDYLTLAELADWSEDYTIEEALDLVTRQRELNFTPGDEYLYSNAGYFLLSQIVERVTGKTLRAWAQEHIFGPLGMRDTHFHDDHTHIVSDSADGYAPTDDGYRISMTTLDMVGDGGVYTTVEDLFLWDRNFSDNHLGAKSAALIETVETPGVLNDGEAIDYAFGLGVGEYRGTREISHGGAFVGFRAAFNRFPDHRLSVAVLCNDASADPGTLARRVADVYLGDELEAEGGDEEGGGGGSESRDSTAATVELPADVLDRYVGEYRNAEEGLIRQIAVEEGRLVYRRGGSGSSELAPRSEAEFVMLDVGADVTVTFETGATPAPRMTVAVDDDEPIVMDRLHRWQPSPEQIAELAGTYYSPELDHTQLIELVDGELVAPRRRETWELEPLDPDAMTASGSTLRFTRDENGAVTGFRLDAGRVKNLWYERRRAPSDRTTDQ